MKIRRKKTLNRRDFIARTGKMAAAALAAPSWVPATVFGNNAPSNRIAFGCIGVGGMGMQNLRGFKANPNSEVVAVCDVDHTHRLTACETAGIDLSNSYNHFQELLDRDDIDAVTVVTPDHWHVPISIAAAKAGKDIYCEKPLTHSITEGRELVKTIRSHTRILQTGSQQRSGKRFRFACELVRNGRIGELKRIEVQIPGNNRQNPVGWQEMPVPDGLDYETWLGPAPWQPYTEKRCHYTFRFILDYSGGQVTNWGAHYLDIAQWGIDADDSGPVFVEGRGNFPKDGLFTTALKYEVEYTYANGVKMVLKTAGPSGTRFIGTEGWLFVNRGTLETYPEALTDEVIGANEIHLYESDDHRQNFIDCIKKRKKPIADVEIGHRSSTVCHLGNIAAKLRRPLQWNPETEQFVNDRAANSLLLPGVRTSLQSVSV